MADEDNFDIDIYGDGEGMDEDSKEFYKQEHQKNVTLKEQQEKVKVEQQAQNAQAPSSASDTKPAEGPTAKKSDIDVVETTSKPVQGVKRKGDSDERRIDPGATNALMISELHWWTTEDDIRAWANEVDAEDELKEITFSEHKVNGKSKGQAFVEFTSPQASTATKRKLETLSSGVGNPRKFTVIFTNVSSNPFKTLPKDAPARIKEEKPHRSTSTPYSGPSHHNYGQSNNFRGGRGSGYNNRGSYNQGYNNNRNFSGSNNMGGFNNGPGFQGNMPMMNSFNNFGGRGGMMGNNMRGNMGGMRGGRGGMNGMMPVGMMGMGMGMNPMMAGLGPQSFGSNGPQFNPGMFNQNTNPNVTGSDWSHGAKRQRQD